MSMFDEPDNQATDRQLRLACLLVVVVIVGLCLFGVFTELQERIVALETWANEAIGLWPWQPRPAPK